MFSSVFRCILNLFSFFLSDFLNSGLFINFLLFLFLFFITLSVLFLDIFHTFEREIVLFQLLEHVDIVLDIVLGHIKAWVDQLEINLLEELLCLWLFPDFKAERYVRWLQNVTPEATDLYFLMLFFMVAWDVAWEGSVWNFVLC